MIDLDTLEKLAKAVSPTDPTHTALLWRPEEIKK
jgi:hypothetical protein